MEDYLAAAARVLAPGGAVVVCADGRAPGRVVRGAAEAGLSPRRRLDVVARGGRGGLSGEDGEQKPAGPLFSVWTCTAEEGPLEREAVVMRDARGERTGAGAEMRAFFGLG